MSTCNEAASLLAGISTDSTDDVYLVLVARNLQVSIVTADSDCDLGDDSCDGGLRQVQLLGRARVAQVPGHRLEHLELPEGRVLHVAVS